MKFGRQLKLESDNSTFPGGEQRVEPVHDSAGILTGGKRLGRHRIDGRAEQDRVGRHMDIKHGAAGALDFGMFVADVIAFSHIGRQS